MEMNLSIFWEIVKDSEAGCAAVHGVQQQALSKFFSDTECVIFIIRKIGKKYIFYYA